MDSWGGEGGPNDHIIIYIPKTYFVKVTIKEGGGQNAQKKVQIKYILSCA